MSINYLSSCSWLRSAEFPSSNQHNQSQHSSCAFPLPWPESIPMQQESSPEQCWVVMLQRGAQLPLSIHLDLCSLSLPLPNEQTNKETKTLQKPQKHNKNQPTNQPKPQKQNPQKHNKSQINKPTKKTKPETKTVSGSLSSDITGDDTEHSPDTAVTFKR